MDKLDLEKFRRAVDLAQLGRRDEAHGILRELRASNPKNSSVLLWQAYTATDLIEARDTLKEATVLDPTNPETLKARNWLVEQEKQRMGKRFRGVITGTFVPQLPNELRNVPSGNISTVLPVPPPNVSPPVGAGQAAVPGKSNAVQVAPPIKKADEQEQVVKKQQIQKVPKVKPVKPPRVKRVRAPVVGKRYSVVGFWKILIGIIIVMVAPVVIAGGLLLIQPVREAVFDTGPLTQVEQNFVSDSTQINDLASTRINQVYNCIVNISPKVCTVEDGYKQAYVGLGEVRDKFQALKNPSNRFSGAFNDLASAYTNLGVTSNFAFESINQHKMVANQTEVASRLDNGRKLLEQGKADLKSMVQQYGSKR